jgi:5'-methylthioadenosine phosphorylase
MGRVFKVSKHVLATKPYHILAKPGDIAERVLAVGDPGRADAIARELLSGAALVNSNRGFNTYTGFFEGARDGGDARDRRPLRRDRRRGAEDAGR